MTWAPLLLADPSACLRWMVLRQLMGLPADHAEVRELEAFRIGDPLVTELVSQQAADGSWSAPVDLSPLKGTALALARLGYLGFGPELPVVQRAAEYLFSRQQPDGSWPLVRERGEGEEDKGYDGISLQTSLPLRGLAACGYATDPRAEQAYDWLLSERLPDGAWPTGKSNGVYGYVAGYRRMAHSRWGCRSNTTGALVCLSLHPQRRHGEEARRALDLLLGRETRERLPMGFDMARLLGAEPSHGFITYFARFDLAQVLGFCARLGAGLDDERVSSLVRYVEQQKGPFGLWEYLPRPQASRWLTFELLRSLSQLGAEAGWSGLEPRTPFQPYPHHSRRFHAFHHR